MTPSIYWLIAGAAFLALEAFGLPGIGLLFVGLGALGTAITIEIGIVGAEDYVMQCAAFFITSAAFAIVLWKRLKAWRIGKEPSYSNIVGDTAIVGKDGLTRGKEGIVHWSGTQMRASLAPEAADAISEGAHVTITAVKGNIVSVK
ncbi:MAG: NfeD family protein [Rickettsiales bacterium]